MECHYLKHAARIDFDGRIIPCCEFKGMVGDHNMNTHTLADYFESKELADIQDKMSREQWPTGCERCKLQEQRGIISLRQRAHLDASVGSHHKLLDIVVGNECNSDCVMCIPEYSSKIAARLRSDPEPDSPIEIDKIKWTNDIDLWRDILIDFKPDTIKIIGGEPFINRSFNKWVQSYTVQKIKVDTKLFITTNASVMDGNIMRALSGWRENLIVLSIDAVGRQYQWLRDGLSWSFFTNTTLPMFKQIKPATISVNHTLGTYSLTGLPKLLQWCDDNDLISHMIPIDDPYYQQLTRAPTDVLSQTLWDLDKISLRDPRNQLNLAQCRRFISDSILNNCYNEKQAQQFLDYHNQFRHGIMDEKTLKLK